MEYDWNVISRPKVNIVISFILHMRLFCLYFGVPLIYKFFSEQTIALPLWSKIHLTANGNDEFRDTRIPCDYWTILLWLLTSSRRETFTVSLTQLNLTNSYIFNVTSCLYKSVLAEETYLKLIYFTCIFNKVLFNILCEKGSLVDFQICLLFFNVTSKVKKNIYSIYSITIKCEIILLQKINGLNGENLKNTIYINI